MTKHLTLAAALLFSTAALADGKSDYDSMCASCHGAAGAGDGAAAANLPVKPANFADAAFWGSRSDDDVKKVIKEGGAAVGKSPMMAPFGSSLSDAQIDAVTAYIKTFKK